MVDYTSYAIPGQSLTREPELYPWKRPPQIADPREAAEYIFNLYQNPDNAMVLLALLDAGQPVRELVLTVLLSGVTNGVYTIDTAALLIKPVVSMVTGIAHAAGIKYKLSQNTVSDLDKTLDALAEFKLEETRDISGRAVAATETSKKLEAGIQNKFMSGLELP